MSRINLKTDYEDGNILHGSELNINNNVTMLGVNDNFDKISNMKLTKADITYVDNELSKKVDLSTLNSRIQEVNLVKADKTELATKANQIDVDKKADKTYVDSQLETKADQSYVNIELSKKVDNEIYETEISNKVDKEVVGDLRTLKTEDKSSVVNAINSINTEAKAIATTETAGIVKPDGTTITIDQDGTIHSVGGGGGTGGTMDYAELSNKPQINNVEIKGNLSLDDLGLMSSIDIEDALDTKANASNVYNKAYIDNTVITAVNAKADKSYVDGQLADKANSIDVYSKTAIDELLTGEEAKTDAKLINKVNTEDVYLKSEIDNKISAKADNLKFEEKQLQLMSGVNPIGDPVTLEVSGNEVIIGTEPPSPEDKNWKIYIDSDEAQNLGSEVVDSLAGNESNLAPSVRAIKEGIIESGPNADLGYYIKYIDGTLICYFSKELSVACNNSWGSLYYGQNTNYFYFAKGFIEKPKVYRTVNITGSSSCWMINYTTPEITKDYIRNVAVARPTSSDNVQFEYNVLAIGRWK